MTLFSKLATLALIGLACNPVASLAQGRHPAMSTAAGNRIIIRDAFDRWQEGHGDIFSLLASDAVLIIPGSGPSSGVWTSKEQFLSEVGRPFLSRFAIAPRAAARAIVAEGDRVVAQFDAFGTGRDGKPYSNSYAWIFVMRDGKVDELTMYYDLAAFDAMKARVPAAAAETNRAEYRNETGRQWVYSDAVNAARSHRESSSSARDR